MILHILDLVSVFAFAYFGANAALAQRFNAAGVLLCAFLPALGGGTIRELLLNHTPVYVHDYGYGVAVIVGAIFAGLTARVMAVQKYMYVLDALGMAVFAYFGSRAALHADLGPTGSAFFSALTACGGGILCDLITHQIPHVFKHRMYALPPLLLGCAFWMIDGTQAPVNMQWALIGGTFALQLIITYGVVQKPLTRLALFRKAYNTTN